MFVIFIVIIITLIITESANHNDNDDLFAFFQSSYLSDQACDSDTLSDEVFSYFSSRDALVKYLTHYPAI